MIVQCGAGCRLAEALLGLVWSPASCNWRCQKHLRKTRNLVRTLEKDKKLGQEEEEVEEEEYVLLELSDCLYSDISSGAPFVLSGLDTLTPTSIVGNGLKMIGEYEETVGTCYLFSESEALPKPASNETTPSEENTDNPTSSSKEAPSKEVNHLASVQKILKFRPVNAERLQHLAYQHKEKEI